MNRKLIELMISMHKRVNVNALSNDEWLKFQQERHDMEKLLAASKEFYMVFGSDGVEMIEKRARQQLLDQPDERKFTIHIISLLALIDYYKQLTKNCKHEMDVTSPIDTAELCRKCGLLRAC